MFNTNSETSYINDEQNNPNSEILPLLIKPNKEGTAYSAPIIYKAFAILQDIAQNQGQLGASDLSRRLNINKSTAYGIIQAFLDLGVVRQDQATKKLRLGTTLIQLGNQALALNDLRARAKPYMEKLSRIFRETVFLGTFDDYGITIVECVESPRSIKITAPPGARIPLFTGAAGKAVLANLDELTQKRLIEEKALPKFTENTITNQQQYLAELQLVRAKGYATDFEEYIKGVNAISVPLVDREGQLLAAIWIVGFSSSFDKSKMEEAAGAAQETVAEIADLLDC